MQIALSQQDREYAAGVRDYVCERIKPFSSKWDSDGLLPNRLIRELSEKQLLATTSKLTADGETSSFVRYGAMTEEIARGCSSVRSLITVHDMACSVLKRWGGEMVRAGPLQSLLSGESLATFALSELEAGSDARQIQTTAEEVNGEYVLNGEKAWITMGADAHWLLVFAKTDESVSAFLVDAMSPGIDRTRMASCVGTRASSPSKISLKGCKVPASFRIGDIGAGVPLISTAALSIGRLSVAFGAVGIAQECLQSMREYAELRIQFGEPLMRKQLVRKIISESAVAVQSARLLSYRAADLYDKEESNASDELMLAKYAASKAATMVSNNAIQIFGAQCLNEKLPIERMGRDARVSEIIEGSSQILEDEMADVIDIDLLRC